MRHSSSEILGRQPVTRKDLRTDNVNAILSWHKAARALRGLSRRCEQNLITRRQNWNPSETRRFPGKGEGHRIYFYNDLGPVDPQAYNFRNRGQYQRFSCSY